MPKRRNPQQETEQETELETQQETTEQETEEQETETVETDQETGTGADAETIQETEETGEQEAQEESEAPASGDSDETAALRRELLQARGRLAAYASGVAHGMIDDAVTLAMAEAAGEGEVTEASLTKAMEAVLKRHPEWKTQENKAKTGGFRLGADRDSGGSYKKPATNQNMKRWNRFK